jgi:hypothetical protein
MRIWIADAHVDLAGIRARGEGPEKMEQYRTTAKARLLRLLDGLSSEFASFEAPDLLPEVPRIQSLRSIERVVASALFEEKYRTPLLVEFERQMADPR